MWENEHDIPELVYSGDYSEALFLKSLLESSDVEASLGGGRAIGKLYVRRRDAAHAQQLVADFMRKKENARDGQEQ